MRLGPLTSMTCVCAAEHLAGEYGRSCLCATAAAIYSMFVIRDDLRNEIICDTIYNNSI